MTSDRPSAVRLSVDGPAGGPVVVTVRLDRPPVNAVDDATKAELIEVAAGLSARRDVGAVVLFGGERFSAGDDIKEMAGLDRNRALLGLEAISQVCSAIEAIPVPVVAAEVTARRRSRRGGPA